MMRKYLLVLLLFASPAHAGDLSTCSALVDIAQILWELPDSVRPEKFEQELRKQGLDTDAVAGIRGLHMRVRAAKIMGLDHDQFMRAVFVGCMK